MFCIHTQIVYLLCLWFKRFFKRFWPIYWVCNVSCVFNFLSDFSLYDFNWIWFTSIYWSDELGLFIQAQAIVERRISSIARYSHSLGHYLLHLNVGNERLLRVQRMFLVSKSFNCTVKWTSVIGSNTNPLHKEKFRAILLSDPPSKVGVREQSLLYK